MKIALMQTDILWENREKNLEKADALLEKASAELCSVAVFPEMFSTGFSMNARSIAEEPDGPVLDSLGEMARRHRIHIIAGVAVKTDDGAFENRAYIFDPEGRVIDHYTKNYSFSYAGEDRVYRAGNHQVLFPLEETKSSVFICYDLRFPELFRKVAKQVSLIFLIANWPDSRIDQWDALLKARAIENQCFIAAVNRKGKDGNGLQYNGHSGIIGPTGEDVDLYKLDGECRFYEIDAGEADFVRERFPFLKDMR